MNHNLLSLVKTLSLPCIRGTDPFHMLFVSYPLAFNIIMSEKVGIYMPGRGKKQK